MPGSAWIHRRRAGEPPTRTVPGAVPAAAIRTPHPDALRRGVAGGDRPAPTASRRRTCPYRSWGPAPGSGSKASGPAATAPVRSAPQSRAVRPPPWTGRVPAAAGRRFAGRRRRPSMPAAAPRMRVSGAGDGRYRRLAARRRHRTDRRACPHRSAAAREPAPPRPPRRVDGRGAPTSPPARSASDGSLEVAGTSGAGISVLGAVLPRSVARSALGVTELLGEVLSCVAAATWLEAVSHSSSTFCLMPSRPSTGSILPSSSVAALSASWASLDRPAASAVCARCKLNLDDFRGCDGLRPVRPHHLGDAPQRGALFCVLRPIVAVPTSSAAIAAAMANAGRIDRRFGRSLRQPAEPRRPEPAAGRASGRPRARPARSRTVGSGSAVASSL